MRKVSFTGSIATGKKIQEAAAKSNLKRVTLELGGKSPAVIFDDCNLENAINCTANALTLNTGQVCFASTRVYVQESIYDKFIEGYKAKLKEMTATIGDPDSADTSIGPLVDEAQFNRVRGFIERGQNGQGAMILGGQRVGDKVRYSNHKLSNTALTKIRRVFTSNLQSSTTSNQMQRLCERKYLGR